MKLSSDRAVKIVGFFGLLKLASGLKLSFIVGSFSAFFSAVSIVMPLSGAFTGISGSSLIALASFLMRFAWAPTQSLVILAHYIPGLFGAYYWASHSIFIRLLVPLVCMFLFIIHPVGGEAYIYSFFWLIPVAIYCMRRKSLYMQALGSTFTAHAVGSVIWLYTVPMISEQWINAMPLVALERCTFACGMLILYKIINLLSSLVQRYIYFARVTHTH